jgi:hypothetical protein
VSIESELAAFDAGIRNAMKDVEQTSRVMQESQEMIDRLARQVQPLPDPIPLAVANRIRREAEAMDRIFDSMRAATRIANPYPKRKYGR